MSRNIEKFCLEQPLQDWEALPISSQDFLTNLDLPSIHPFCEGHGFAHPMAPPMGPPIVSSNVIETVVTAWYFYIPPLMALLDLWARLLSCWVAPLSFLYLFLQRLKRRKQNSAVFCVSVFCSWILMTDDQYIIQFGRSVGFFLLIVTVRVSNTRLLFSRSIYILAIMALIYPTPMDDPEEIASIEPGLYSNNNNPMIQSIIRDFQWKLPSYSDIATPWLLSGDARTGVPYLLNSVARPEFHRVWLPTIDDEFLALDIAFPQTGHDIGRPIYLVFHGLNGGSEEGYVMDLTRSRLEHRSTVVVMVARGMMNTPIQGWTFSHGARIIDAHSAAQTLKARVVSRNQTLAGIGYSLGAIVLNNYIASYENNVALDVGVSISGAIACRFQQDFRRSQLTWQPLIAACTKKNYLNQKWGQRLYHQLGSSDYQGLMRATSVVDVDGYSGAQYNGFASNLEFYTAMSAIDPNNPFQKHISIPHLILHAFDDPISTWRNNAASDSASPLYPSTLVNEIQENLVLLLTKTGGHVGWPTGWWPCSWTYMNDHVAAGFVDSYEISHGRSPAIESGETFATKTVCKQLISTEMLANFHTTDQLSTVVES